VIQAKKVRSVIAIACLMTVGAVAFIASFRGEDQLSRKPFYGEGAVVRYLVRIKNKSSEYLDEKVTLFLPRNARYILSEGVAFAEDKEGNRDLTLHVKIPPYGKREFALEGFDFSEPAVNGVSEYKKIDQATLSSLREILEDLPSADDHTVGRAVFRFITKSIKKSTYLPAARSIRTTLEKKAGDCTDHASLFVELMRAKGIPARVCAGFIRDGSHLRPELYHNWAEFLVEGKWTMVDPFLEKFDAGQEELIPVRCGERATVEGLFSANEKLEISLDSKV